MSAGAFDLSNTCFYSLTVSFHARPKSRRFGFHRKITHLLTSNVFAVSSVLPVAKFANDRYGRHGQSYVWVIG